MTTPTPRKHLLGLYRFAYCPKCGAKTCHTCYGRRLWICNCGHENTDPVWVRRPILPRLRNYG